MPTPPREERRRLARRTHRLALLCPVFAAAATVGAFFALLGLSGLLGVSPDRYAWVVVWIVLPLNGLLATVGAMAVELRLHPTREDGEVAAVFWLVATTFVYLAAIVALVIALAALGVR